MEIEEPNERILSSMDRYLHDRGINHRDLKSSNVFLDMCGEPDDPEVCWRVRIGDFGLAAVKTVLAEGVNQQFQPTGSVLWMVREESSQSVDPIDSLFTGARSDPAERSELLLNELRRLRLRLCPVRNVQRETAAHAHQ